MIEVPKKDKVLAVVDLDDDDAVVDSGKESIYAEVTKDPVNSESDKPNEDNSKSNDDKLIGKEGKYDFLFCIT